MRDSTACLLFREVGSRVSDLCARYWLGHVVGWYFEALLPSYPRRVRLLNEIWGVVQGDDGSLNVREDRLL
jgi:hypothetical protein